VRAKRIHAVPYGRHPADGGSATEVIEIPRDAARVAQTA